MTNSVYYSTEGGQPQIAVPIAPDALFSTEQAATDSNNPVVIYVERVVARVNLTKGETVTQTNNTVGDYTLDFSVLGWGLNCIEKNTYLVKNFRASGNNTTTVTNMDYSTANSESNFGSLTNPAWNYPAAGGSVTEGNNWGISGGRSFWAVSPTYFAGGTYPEFADQYEPNKYSLKYISFEQIGKENAAGEFILNANYGAPVGGTLYSLEHTMEPGVITNHQDRAITSAVIVGKYTVKQGSTPVTTDHFYIQSALKSDGTTIKQLYPTERAMKKAFLSKNNLVFVKNPDGSTPAYSPVPWDNENYLQLFEVKHPSHEISDGRYTPNRYVSLLLSNEEYSHSTVKFYYFNGTSYSEIGSAAGQTSITEVNKRLWELMNVEFGNVEKFHNGYAYFQVPIKHLWNRNAPGIGDDNFQALLGQYGIVRNHSYTIKFTGIDGIGTAIGDPTKPIIPNVENDKYVIKAEIRTQRWRVVPTQNVVLKPKG